jgi:hypothetical protein
MPRGPPPEPIGFTSRDVATQNPNQKSQAFVFESRQSHSGKNMFVSHLDCERILDLSPDIPESHQIKVETFKQVVQLSGFVDSSHAAKKAGEVAG